MFSMYKKQRECQKQFELLKFKDELNFNLDNLDSLNQFK